MGRKLISAMKAAGRPLDGFIAQIAAPETRKELPKEKGEPFPIATFVTMDRDKGTDELVNEVVLDLQRQGYPAKHIRLPPLPLTDSFFHDRMPEYSEEKSKTMVQALERQSYTHVENGQNYLYFDPRGSKWRDVLRKYVACPPDCLNMDQSAVSEVLNTAWGMHELSRDGVQESIAFILREHADKGSS